MEDVTLSDLFGREVAWVGVRGTVCPCDGSLRTDKQTGTHGKLIPLALGDKPPLLLQKLLVSPVHFWWPPLVLIIGCFTTQAWLLLLSMTGLIVGIRKLQSAIPPLLGTGRSLVLWVVGCDVVAWVIVGMCSGLFLGGRSRRESGGRRQRGIRSSILTCRRIVCSRRQRIQQGLNVNIGGSLGRLRSIGIVMRVWVGRVKILSRCRGRVTGSSGGARLVVVWCEILH